MAEGLDLSGKKRVVPSKPHVVFEDAQALACPVGRGVEDALHGELFGGCRQRQIRTLKGQGGRLGGDAWDPFGFECLAGQPAAGQHPGQVAVGLEDSPEQVLCADVRVAGDFECLAASGLKQARYKLYTLQRAVMLSAESRDRLAGVRLYAIVTGELCQASLEWTVRELLAGGVQALQLREKSLPDRSLLDRARLVRRWTREAGAMFIMNDRADLARLADADGLHVGQSELSVKDARRIVGPSAVIGVSTHAIEQARQAVLDAAGYIGVGPLFAGPTKTFQALAGLDYLREVVGEIALPAFAIGGINLENVDSVLSAGARRIAVCSVLCGAEDPRDTARRFRDKVDSAN